MRFTFFKKLIAGKLGVFAETHRRPSVRLAYHGRRKHHAAADKHFSDPQRRAGMTVKAAVADIPQSRHARNYVLSQICRMIVAARKLGPRIESVIHSIDIVRKRKIIRIKTDKRFDVGIIRQNFLYAVPQSIRGAPFFSIRLAAFKNHGAGRGGLCRSIVAAVVCYNKNIEFVPRIPLKHQISHRGADNLTLVMRAYNYCETMLFTCLFIFFRL